MNKPERKDYSDKKFVYVRRLKDGAILDMTEQDWFENTTNKDEFEFVDYITSNKDISEAPTFRTDGDENMHACPIDGKTFKTEAQLQNHRKKAHA